MKTLIILLLSQILVVSHAHCETFVETITENPDLDNLISNPVIQRNEIQAVLTELTKALKFTKPSINFLSLLVEKRRLSEIHGILAAYKLELETQASSIVAQVESSHELTKAQIEKLSKTLSKKTGQDVQIEVKVTPNLIGGIIIHMGSILVDASVQNKLTKIKHLLERVHHETASS